MTTDLIVRALKGKRSGSGKWRAKCPSHGSNSGSLVISRRPNRSTGIHCFAGCPVSDVMGAIGLKVSDLFDGPGITDPRKLRELEIKRKREEADRRLHNYRTRSLIDQCRYWEQRYEQLGRELAETDSEKTATLFHAALSRFRALEAQVNPILHPKGV